MTAHYIKIALRNLAKHKAQTIISIVSIGVSVTIFSIVSSWMIRINGDSLLSQEYEEDVAVMSVKPGPDSFADYGEFDPSELMGRQFKTLEKLYMRPGKILTASAVCDDSDPVIAKCSRIAPDFLQWCGYKSAITGLRISAIDKDEIIITQRAAENLFGEKYGEATGKQIALKYSEEGGFETRSYVIADVLAPVSLSDHKLPSTAGIYHADDIGVDNVGRMAYLQIRKGKRLEEVAEELAQCLGIPAYEIHITGYEAWVGETVRMQVMISRAAIFFMLLFVMFFFSSCLRQWLQLFAMRRREVAIRKSLGGKNSSILMMFFTETFLKIGGALSFTIVCNLLIIRLTINYLPEILASLGIKMSTIFLLALGCYAVIVAVCLLATWCAVKQISPDRQGLASQMRPSRHLLRNVGISLQIIISIWFLSITIAFASGFKRIEEHLGIPEDKSRYQAGVYVQSNMMSETQMLQIRDELRKIKSIDRFTGIAKEFVRAELADSSQMMATTFKQRENEIVDFYDLSVHWIEPNKAKRSGVIVNKAVKEIMEEKGEWDSRRIRLHWIRDAFPESYDNNEIAQYEIVGWFDKMPFEEEHSRVIVIAEDYVGKSNLCRYYILPKEEMEEQMLADLRSLVRRVAPDALDAIPADLSFILLGEIRSVMMLLWLSYIVLGVSLLLTVASIYDAIDFDTRRRRKEMALRKINGAKSKDICMIFARVYFIILAVSMGIAIPISMLQVRGIKVGYDLSVSPVGVSIMASLITAFVVFVTLYGHIRNVMSVDPVNYLKE